MILDKFSKKNDLLRQTQELLHTVLIPRTRLRACFKLYITCMQNIHSTLQPTATFYQSVFKFGSNYECKLLIFRYWLRRQKKYKNIFISVLRGILPLHWSLCRLFLIMKRIIKFNYENGVEGKPDKLLICWFLRLSCECVSWLVNIMYCSMHYFIEKNVDYQFFLPHCSVIICVCVCVIKVHNLTPSLDPKRIAAPDMRKEYQDRLIRYSYQKYLEKGFTQRYRSCVTVLA